MVHEWRHPTYLGSGMTDMGHFDSFEFVLCKCSKFGAYWTDIFCIVSNSTGY